MAGWTRRLWACGAVLGLCLTRPPSRRLATAPSRTREVVRELDMDRARYVEYDRQRAFDEGFSHWADAMGPGMATPSEPQASPAPAPAVAGLVAIADALGLRQLAAMGLYLMADAAEERGDGALMLLYLRATTVLDPHFVAPSLILAYVVRKRDPAYARAILQEALAANPGDWELYHDLAWLSLRPGAGAPRDLEEAVRLLRGGVAVRHPVFLRRLLAMAEALAGVPERAVELLRPMTTAPELVEADRRAAARLAVALARGANPLARQLGRRELGPRERDVATDN